MSQAYEEIIYGESLLRSAPDPRHEQICERLHRLVTACLVQLTVARLLTVRTIVRVSPGSLVRPDLALVTAATGKLWLAAEVVASRDHRPDTVMKKALYEETKLPRLWMIDPRYDNVEVYHGGTYGLVLKRILANAEVLAEPLLPGFQITAKELFAA